MTLEITDYQCGRLS